MAKQKNFILAISGVAGAGKDSILNFLKGHPENFVFSLSYTDRPPRPGEKSGDSYNLISKEEFSESIDRGEFLEWEATRNESRYGIKRRDFEELLASGKIIVLQIDVKGMVKLRKKYDLVSIFLTPPSLEEAIHRLRARGTDSAESIQLRVDRYNLEIGYEHKYNYIVVNDILERAETELLAIIRKEEIKRQREKTFFKFLLLPLLFLFLAGTAYATQKFDFKNLPYINQFFPTETAEVKPSGEVATPTQAVPAAIETPTIVAPPPKAVTNTIKKAPPKTAVAKSSTPVEGTKTNTDGSTTTTVSTSGGASSADLAKATASAGVVISSISDILFTDQTGSHADLGQILKDYLSSTLEHRDEVTSLKSITLEDAGATGWNGQYLGSYTVGADGRDITSATGNIILNSYYYKDSPIFNDYMKLIFSHEYGHHYTLYHKWVDWDLSATVRLPDSYYSTRPLAKATTAVDYSLGWLNCESEIIAEDYSYIYSGYGVDAMSSIYGYPNAAIKSWLEKIGSADLLSSGSTNNPPIITITAPAASSTLSGAADFTADATDDGGVRKVSFFIDSNLLAEDSSAPYAVSLETTGYINGAHTLKVIASDGILTSEQLIPISIQNQTSDLEKPLLFILSPASNPNTIYENNLVIHVQATDNDKISKIEMYYNDALEGSWDTSDLSLRITLSTPGTYDLKFKAYDRAGNIVETTLTIIRAPLVPPTP